MGKVVGPPIPQDIKDFILKQHLFFVASAPLSAKNRVNVSPKSANEFRILDDDLVAYLDYTGSGSETIAHIMENGRLTFMFVALNGAPKISRLHGRGSVVLATDLFRETKEMKQARSAFGIETMDDWNKVVGLRSIILLKVERVSASCGFSIPKYEYIKERSTLHEYNARADVPAYICKKNSFSIDGLKSVGQVNRNDVPTTVWEEDGYILASYDKSASLLQKLHVKIRMLMATGLNGKQRDLTMFLFGVLVCLGMQRLRR